MTGTELIEWLSGECSFRKVPASDSAMILLLRELPDVESAVKTIRHKSPAPYRKCVSCGVETDYCCADCMIDKKEKVYVCGRTQCRDKHETQGCTRVGI